MKGFNASKHNPFIFSFHYFKTMIKIPNVSWSMLALGPEIFKDTTPNIKELKV